MPRSAACSVPFSKNTGQQLVQDVVLRLLAAKLCIGAPPIKLNILSPAGFRRYIKLPGSARRKTSRHERALAVAL